MRVFLDTEFSDWDDPAPELISLALVAEDGREFYAECTDFDRVSCALFVQDGVLLLLGAPGVRRLDRSALKRAVLDWLADIPEAEIAVDYDGDWRLLCRLLGDDVPDGLTVRNVYASLDRQMLERYYLQQGVHRHHALHDARSLRCCSC